jgi:hypothetical protein
MPTGGHTDPLAGIDRLLVDANNLLHAIRRGPEPPPPATLIGRLRGVIPPAVAVELVFDGPPDPGSRGRIASGVRVRYAGQRTADALLKTLVEVVGPPIPGDDPSVLVVTDDRELRAALRMRGARTIGTAWLVRRLERARLDAPSTGRPRPPGRTTHAAPSTSGPGRRPGDIDEDLGRGGWRAGRGATRKTGNPRRKPKRERRTDEG